MSQKYPILILQMQRMGDLVLSFPLMGWLESLYPENPIWVVGEKNFFEGLLEISPPVTYFSYSDSPALEALDFSMVVNLSHRPEAAELSGKLRTERRIGPYTKQNGALHIEGGWQLYRSSIIHNNRHNLFHWSDLNAMDLVPQSSMHLTDWPPVSYKVNTEPRVGLFVGASEPDKRPEAEFWADLAKRLLQSGIKPVFLGGKDDTPVAAKAAALLGTPGIDLSGHFSIIQLCQFIRNLDLLIVPDTGPMHIAAWTSVPTLNISTGPVNPWETGPFSPGHYVLRQPLSCDGCWTCVRKNVLCKDRLHSGRVAFLASLILEGKHEQLKLLDERAGRIYRTRRDSLGLHDLELLNPAAGSDSASPILNLKQDLSLFWKAFFSLELGFTNQAKVNGLLCAAVEKIPGHIKASALSSGQKMLLDLSRAVHSQKTSLSQVDFWLKYPPLMRPLSSYIQLLLHNEDFSRKSLSKALLLTESFLNKIKI